MDAPTVETNAQVNSDPYAHPEKFCDIVMKGGIASGVVYPSAVCELAKTYSFKNIGGASAGAIAAATAAAAEYGRRMGAQKDGSSGFARLEQLPAWLANNLSSLFQPNPSTRPLYNILYKSIGLKGGVLKKVLVVLPVAMWNFLRWAGLGLIVGALLLIPLADFLSIPETPNARIILFGYGSLFALVFFLLCITVFVAIGLFRKVKSAIPDNHYGLVSGLIDPAGNDTQPPLTTWMADELDRLAGKDRAHPLTFGDLWGATSELDRELLGDEGGGIKLEMMTTNLTLGRPYRLPFDSDSTEFFYDPVEWRKFFPEHIVAWMEAHPRASTHKPGARADRQKAEWASFQPRLPLPAPEHIPVVVAARMSLSFPVLFSAVPLYKVDRARELEVDETTGENVGKPKLEKCLFSDGGISSNFPIHFFDKPLPRWPTFGINLIALGQGDELDANDQSKNSYLPNSNEGGKLDAWDRFNDNESGLGKLGGFFGALVNTMYNWADNTQMRVPGYRDRVIHIFQAEEEGGMNINMAPEVIKGLIERGRFAGQKLRERFMGLDGSKLTWDNHRWVRYRSTMALLETLLEDLHRTYRKPLPGDQQYDVLITRKTADPPGAYRWKSKEQRDFARDITAQLLKLAEEWSKYEHRFGEGQPNPPAELRVKPRI